MSWNAIACTDLQRPFSCILHVCDPVNSRPAHLSSHHHVEACSTTPVVALCPSSSRLRKNPCLRAPRSSSRLAHFTHKHRSQVQPYQVISRTLACQNRPATRHQCLCPKHDMSNVEASVSCKTSVSLIDQIAIVRPGGKSRN